MVECLKYLGRLEIKDEASRGVWNAERHFGAVVSTAEIPGIQPLMAFMVMRCKSRFHSVYVLFCDAI